ncbi:MAG: acyloxyacyl hydrolase [Nitrospinae bacterium]|nr:acyloxyacyl hydrolase [Nitrospinota bacterium]MBL7020639.1 acyloxyacyl hydrolase [Nitrospinaceae bacterium]
MVRIVAVHLVLLMLNVATAGAENFSQRFEKGSSDFGGQFGWGHNFNLPPGPPNRTDMGFAFLFPNWQRNLTGVIGGDSWYQGALFYHMEAGLAFADRDDKFLLGWSPVMAQYKFLSPKRRWAPNILLGAGFSMTNWKDVADRELGSEFQFLLHAGAGLEYFKKEGAYSINYRLFHVSNAGIQFPNIGLNAHVFSLGMRF